MYGLFIYSLKAGLCLAVFYLFFKLLLSRETLHRFNRLLVLSGMALAFALPLCVITVYRELPAVPVIDTVPAQEFVRPQDAAHVWQPLLGAFFVAGAVGMLLWTLCSLLAVFRIVRSGRRERLDDGTVLVRVPQAVAPFSWGRYIVVPEAGTADCEREILLHERAHVRLGHSADLLLTDLAGCLQWFNPAMWLLRRELRAIHEYEADRAVIESGVDARDYQLLLIKKAVGGRWYSVANSFNHSKLKNRITMMLRKKSSRWTGARALFVLPLTAAALGAFAQTAYVVSDDKVTKESVSVALSDPEISAEGTDKVVVIRSGRDSVPSSPAPSPESAAKDAAGFDKIEAYFNSDEWKAKEKELAKIDEYFQSDEWKAKEKELAKIDEYFQSDEWESAMQRLTEAGLQTAKALQQLEAESPDGPDVSIQADRYREQPDESGVTRATGRITVTGTAGFSDDCLIFINGKRSTKAKMAKIPAGKIRSMTIYKGEQAVGKFGPDAAAGAIDIKTRKR